MSTYPPGVGGGETIRLGGSRWWIRPGLDRRSIEARLGAALELVARGRAPDLKSGRRKQLYPLALDRPGPPDHLLKRNRYPVWRGLARSLGRSKSRRELAVAGGLVERGVSAVVPLAAGERRRGGRLVECSLLIPLLDDVADLRRCAADSGFSPTERRELASALGALVRRAHDAGLLQDDLAPNNVLVRRARPRELWLIDFERATLRRGLRRGDRRWMLAKLHRALPGVEASQRLRFLRGYAGGDRIEARRWWGELREVAPRLAARDHARMRRAAASEGRRFRRVEGEGWHGLARRETPTEILADAARAEARSGAATCIVEGADGSWRIHYPGAPSRRWSRELWARANTLFARELAPRPLGVLLRPQSCLLLIERAAGERALRVGSGESHRPLEGGSVRRLLERLMSVGELDDALGPELIALRASGAGAPRATLIAPHVFRFSRRGGGPGSREVAARLLRQLDVPF
jgi:hypothetical protein